MEAGRLRALSLPGALVLGMALALPARAIDWASVPSHEILIFHTGQASYEWTLTERDHSGGPKIREGKDCLECHQGEEKKIGELIASGEKLEPTPDEVSTPWSPVEVQLAVDAERFALRLRWPAKASHSDIAFMFDDGSLNAFTLTGCWATCHADLIGMAHDEGDELTKYLTRSRTKVTREGGGTRYESAANLEKLVSEGTFLEYWRAKVGGDGVEAREGWILEKRHESAASALAAQGGREGDMWSVVLSRPRKASGPHQKPLVAGKTYTFGIAVHDGDAEGRFHRVSFEHRFEIEGDEVRLVDGKP
jgi:cytochrome c-type protein NapC